MRNNPPGQAVALVTAANDAYFRFLEDMLTSLGSKLNEYDLKVLDLGLSDANKGRLCEFQPGVEVVDPGWPHHLAPPLRRQRHKMVQFAKPRLPHVFPGYSAYAYVDADIWFQHPDALDDYAAAARGPEAAFCYQSHPLARFARIRSIKVVFGHDVPRTPDFTFLRQMRRLYGLRAATELGTRPYINAGLFYMGAESPIWSAWHGEMQRARFKRVLGKSRIVDQPSLMMAVHGGAETLPHGIMPATHNFLPRFVRPMVSASTGELLDPMWPNRPIKVIHLITRDRYGFQLPLSDSSGQIQTDLDHHSYLAMRRSVSARANAGTGASGEQQSQ